MYERKSREQGRENVRRGVNNDVKVKTSATD